MTLGSLDSEISKETALIFISDGIMRQFRHLFPEERDRVRATSLEIVSKYSGNEVRAILTLVYAVERGRFYEFAGRMEIYYKEKLDSINPELRDSVGIPEAQEFFDSCCRDLGVKF